MTQTLHNNRTKLPKEKLRRGKTETLRPNKKEMRRLRRQGWDPATANLPAIIPIKVVRPFLNLQGLSKFAMVKLRNFGNDLSLLYTHMMHSLSRMLSQDRGIGPPMS